MSAITGKASSYPRDEEVAELVGLIKQVAEGDHVAFRKLYDLTHRRLFGVALLLLRSRDAAEDAVQEAFIKIWRKAGSFDPVKGTPIAWLARIVRNIALDDLRRKMVRTDSLDDHIDAAAEAPLSTAAMTNINKCLETMEPNQRAAWWMVHIDGLSREDVALRMRAPVGTVKSWVFRSSKRIRGAVEG